MASAAELGGPRRLNPSGDRGGSRPAGGERAVARVGEDRSLFGEKRRSSCAGVRTMALMRGDALSLRGRFLEEVAAPEPLSGSAAPELGCRSSAAGSGAPAGKSTLICYSIE